MIRIHATASGKPAVDRVFYWTLGFRLREFWVGVRWSGIGNCVDLYLNPAPCVCFHLCWFWHDPEQ